MAVAVVVVVVGFWVDGEVGMRMLWTRLPVLH